jgi:type IV pilus assembly protein PilC
MKFIYTAKNIATGETRGGDIDAKSDQDVAKTLRAEGWLITSLKEVRSDEKKPGVKFFDRFVSVPLKEKMIFTRNLAVMVSSGLTISRAVSNLSEQTGNKAFRKILLSVHDDLQGGLTLSEGLAKFPTVFNELFVNMISVGEVSGNLEEVLEILAMQLEKENDLTSKVRGALMYPAVIFVAMIGIAVLMLTYILPKITGVFKDMDVTLPKSTLFIMGMSDFLIAHYIIVIFLFIGGTVGVKVLYGQPFGKRWFHWLFLSMPIVGNIIIKVNCARFARIYSSLLRSGVSVVDSLSIVMKTLTNVYYKDALTVALNEIQKGVELSVVIRQYPNIFPILVPQIIEVGEETGKTEAVLSRLADFYEGEVDQITKNMSSILEPILMLFIGGGVGFFAVAMLTPMYSVLENIK